ncbi:MAG: hypothetical protein HY653_03195 [Acidobacteria bacterium]|nr:hypothetical protein [Acidobacteriota bacterium]
MGVAAVGALAALAVFSGQTSTAEKLERGRLLTRELQGQIYYLYIPHAFSPGGALLVSVHGASRGAEAHARAWVPIAEQENVVVVAPLFDFGAFPDYQRLNFRGPRADLRLHAILDEVARLTGADATRFYLYGFSGGGQFAHRYALVHPERLQRVAVGAPGWWCLPEETLDYPYGIKKTSEVPADVEFQVDELLRLPLAVVIGEKDTERDRNLRQDELVDRLQGSNRLERGRNWYTRMRRLAEEKKIANQFELHVVNGAGHSGVHPAIIEHAAAFLFPRSESGAQD